MALIVGRPGPLRDSLRALMAAMPQIKTVGEADDLASAAGMMCGRYPALVVLDPGAAGESIWLSVRRVRGRWPQARCIFLANDTQQQGEAEAAGADAVVLKGFPAARLVAVIVRLFSQPARRQAQDDAIPFIPDLATGREIHETGAVQS